MDAIECKLVELEKEWPKMRLSFYALDRYIAYQMKMYGRPLDELLDSLIAYLD